MDSGQLDPVDEAELRSLTGSINYELRNPRPDVLTVERSTARLAAALAYQRTPPTTPLVDPIVRLGDLGVEDPSLDRLAATGFLQSLPLLQGTIDAAVQSAVDNADSAFAQRLERIESQIAGSNWSVAIAQNLLAAAVYAIIAGAYGLIIRSIVYLIIVVYNVL